MELQSISIISRQFNISVRTLRYYEQIGLINSTKKGDSAYRYYDGDTVRRLQQIIILRKLQIPVRQISVILNNPRAAMVIDIFKENISEIEKEMAALSTIKFILEKFVSEIEKITAVHLNLDLLNEDSVQKLAESISLIPKNIKESFNMNELNQAAEQLNKQTEEEVKAVHLPPALIMENNNEFTWEQAGSKLTRYKFEVVKFEPCRFIGKTVYARGFNLKGSAEIFSSLWEQSKWIFDILDNMKEYSIDEVHDAALLTWDKYDDKNGLIGYTVGRFMKADTPVPIANTSCSEPETDMDYIDTPETYLGKGYIRGTYKNMLYSCGGETVMHEAFEHQDMYEAAPWKFMAELYLKPDENGISEYRYYLPCNLKNPPQINTQ